MSEPNINPCGCGGKMKLVDAYAHLKQRPSCNKYELVCQECRLQVRHPSRSTHKLISVWNHIRPALDGDKELVEVLEAIHEAIQSRAEDTVWFSETMTVCEFIEHTIAEQKEQS